MEANGCQFSFFFKKIPFYYSFLVNGLIIQVLDSLNEQKFTKILVF